MTCCTDIPLPSNTVATRAAMCQTCRHAARVAGSATVCTIDGRELRAVVFADSPHCPQGRFPDPLGRVHWWGSQWWGVPEPLRWVLTLALGREPVGLDGCGCLVALIESRWGETLAPLFDWLPALRARMGAALAEWKELPI